MLGGFCPEGCLGTIKYLVPSLTLSGLSGCNVKVLNERANHSFDADASRCEVEGVEVYLVYLGVLMRGRVGHQLR